MASEKQSMCCFRGGGETVMRNAFHTAPRAAAALHHLTGLLVVFLCNRGG